MRRFVRPVDHGDGPNLVRAVDPVDVPDSIQDADAWLSTMFAHQKAGWVAASEWFVPADPSIESGAEFTKGADITIAANFTNPPSSPASKPTTIPALDFIKRFTMTERAAIQGAAKTDNLVGAFQFELTKADNVNLLDPDTIAGTNYLEQQTLIAAGRAAQILSP